METKEAMDYRFDETTGQRLKLQFLLVLNSLVGIHFYLMGISVFFASPGEIMANM
jgi:hypothetical protein